MAVVAHVSYAELNSTHTDQLMERTSHILDSDVLYEHTALTRQIRDNEDSFLSQNGHSGHNSWEIQTADKTLQGALETVHPPLRGQPDWALSPCLLF